MSSYPESAGSKIIKEKFEKKLKSCNIDDFKISAKSEDCDDSIVIIGVDLKTLDIDLYGYDYDIDIINFMLGHLQQKFPDHKFVTKSFYSVL